MEVQAKLRYDINLLMTDEEKKDVIFELDALYCAALGGNPIGMANIQTLLELKNLLVLSTRNAKLED